MTVRVVTLPNGKQCSIGRYVSAWRTLKTLPEHQHVKGFDHFGAAAGWILARMRDGLTERINTRGALTVREASPARIFKLWERARGRGALNVECRWCGSIIPARVYVNRNNNGTRFCDDSCRQSHSL